MQNGEDAAGSKWPAAFSESGQRKIIWLFCLLAAIHVFVFSAAFPFFNNVDEPMHFDLVVKYSHSHVPLGKETVSPDSATYLALFSSCMYYGTPDKFGGKMPSPPWVDPAQMQQDMNANRAGWQSMENYEVSQAPLYYVLTGTIWRVGQWLRIDPGHLLYYLHFFNILLMIILVWLAYAASRLIFPKNPFLRLGVPALLVFLPQTAFYSITNDIFSPVCFGATFICLVKWLRTQTPSPLLGIVTGLAFAATYLTKVTNLPLLAVVGVGLLIHITKSLRHPGAVVPALLAFLACAIPPIVGWAFWCKFHYGDFTGSKIATEFWGWTVKPFADWWHHPIFSPVGLWTYLSGQLVTFWQGEFSWLNRPLILPGTTTLYSILSLALLAVAMLGLFPRYNPNAPQRQALCLGLACFVATLGFFAVLSIVYDFTNSPNPTSAHPYIHQGRLMLGALIPFLLLIAYGLDHALNRFGNRVKFFTLALLILGMLAVEIATDWAVFSSPFNWYHLP
jgi:predicted membrane protein DUF2142